MGISTIMRYTLRLLTADQAGRLVRLCGAMNKVWADEKNADVSAPFTVGMWIGESSSPNKFFRNPRFSGSTTVRIFSNYIFVMNNYRNRHLFSLQHALGAEMNPSVRWTIGRLTKYIQMEELCLN